MTKLEPRNRAAEDFLAQQHWSSDFVWLQNQQAVVVELEAAAKTCWTVSVLSTPTVEGIPIVAGSPTATGSSTVMEESNSTKFWIAALALWEPDENPCYHLLPDAHSFLESFVEVQRRALQNGQWNPKVWHWPRQQTAVLEFVKH